MTFDLQYIVALDFAVFFALFAGVAPLMQKAMTEKIHSLINESLRSMTQVTDSTLASDVMKRVVDHIPSPFAVFGEARVMLFFVSLLAFAMFFSQVIASTVCYMLHPAGNAQLVYGFTRGFGFFYILIALAFMMYESMWQTLFSHVTLGKMGQSKDVP